jgi:hypothetical protein
LSLAQGKPRRENNRPGHLWFRYRDIFHGTGHLLRVYRAETGARHLLFAQITCQSRPRCSTGFGVYSSHEIKLMGKGIIAKYATWDRKTVVSTVARRLGGWDSEIQTLLTLAPLQFSLNPRLYPTSLLGRLGTNNPRIGSATTWDA